MFRAGSSTDPSGVVSIPATADANDPRSLARFAEATMTIGTDVTRGAIVRWCAAGTCEVVPGARPRGRIVAKERSPVLTVAFERAPVALEAIHRAGDEVVQREDLRPGSLAAWKVNLRPGLQEVRFRATWRDGETLWVFAIEGPKR